MSATRDEVLRAMARALCSGYGLCPTCESAGQCVGDMNEGAFLDEAKRALAAAEQAGWVLVPAEADEAMERIREAVGELERAWSFHDRVVASSPDERSAVGQDHYNWCERAARAAIQALQP